MPRKTQAKQKASTFARVLSMLLVETGFYTRSEWSQFLGISEPAISQWVNDHTVPRADLLRMVIELLKIRGGVAAGEALMELEAIMDEPAEKISPIGSRFAPSLRSYLRVRSLTEMGRALREMPIAEQIALLRDGGNGARPVDAKTPPAETTKAPITMPQGLGPAWRVPRLVRASGQHGRERPVSLEEFTALPRIVLVGTPGSGKTAFLHHLQHHVPSWQRSEAIGLRNYSPAEVGEWAHARVAANERSLLIVDGLDEMPMGDREDALEILGRVAEEAPEARMLVATRPVGGLERLSAFDNLTIAPLSDVDVVAEVTRSAFAYTSPVEVDRFLCHLTERESLKPALRNPLFLQIAWSLFENSAVTPFSEGMIVRECARGLLERDHIKGFSRVREPWASSQILFALLGEVSFHLLRRHEETFDAARLTKWIDQTSWKVPVSKLLDLLLVQGVLIEDDEQYCFSHRILRDYFAARYVIESAVSAVDYFRTVPKQPMLRGAMRMACSLASDATPLLETVIGNQGCHGANFTLLAEMLAQPIVARPETLADSSRALVSWLDDQTSGWKLIEDDTVFSDLPARWLVCAEVGRIKEADAVVGTLRAIHQARSGPAYEPLKAHLSEARSPFLPKFSEAMDVEGRLKVSFGSEHMSHGAARVAVESLQLA